MLKRVKLSGAKALLISLFACSIQADDVVITNPTDQPVQFKVTVPSTGLKKSVTLKPKETQNAIGTDLWHNVRVIIFSPDADPHRECALVVDEAKVSDSHFYLPKVSALGAYRLCPYTTNVPQCGCFNQYMIFGCLSECTDITNAKVTVKKPI